MDGPALKCQNYLSLAKMTGANHVALDDSRYFFHSVIFFKCQLWMSKHHKTIFKIYNTSQNSHDEYNEACHVNHLINCMSLYIVTLFRCYEDRTLFVQRQADETTHKPINWQITSQKYHPSIFYTRLIRRSGRGGAGVYPSSHRARGGVHPGQVASPSQGHNPRNTLFPKYNVQETFLTVKTPCKPKSRHSSRRDVPNQ